MTNTGNDFAANLFAFGAQMARDTFTPPAPVAPVTRSRGRERTHCLPCGCVLTQVRDDEDSVRTAVRCELHHAEHAARERYVERCRREAEARRIAACQHDLYVYDTGRQLTERCTKGCGLNRTTWAAGS